MDDLVTIAEAAEILGQHRNTIRNKVKKGTLVSIMVPTEHGETYMIPKAALNGESVTVTLPNHVVDVSTMVGNETESSVATVDQQERARDAIRELIAPFVAELSQKTQELGQAQERCKWLESENIRLTQALGTAKTAPVPAPERAWWERLLGR